MKKKKNMYVRNNFKPQKDESLFVDRNKESNFKLIF